MTTINQKGQASIFVLALIGVVLICTIFLYQSGRLTSEKMQLQNAADAAAFGASTLEARSLNFAAYTNRAMVANEVAVGQMVGMLSFVDELKTTGEYLDEYAGGLEAATAWLFAVITVGDVVEGIITTIVGFMEDIGTTMTETGEEAEKTMEVLISPLIRGLSIINTVYSISQTAYHGATIYLVTTNILQSLEDNVPGTTPSNIKNIFDPDKPGAHLSDLGILALVGHLPSYWEGYTKQYSPEKQKKKKKPAKDTKKEKEDEKIVAKDKQQIKTDQDQVTKGHKIIAADDKKITADVTKQGQDQAQYTKQQEKCKILKEKLAQEKTAENQQNYNTCEAQLAKTKDTLGKDKRVLQKDRDTKKEHQKQLTKDQAKLKQDQKQLTDEEEQEAKDNGSGNGGNETNAGMQRMAATIREARDPFSSGGPPIWDKDIYNSNFKFGNRDWKFGLGMDIPVLGVGHLNFFTGLDSNGGSELRYKGNNYGWSALDTAVLEASLEVQIKFYFKLFGIKIGIDIDDTVGLGIPTGGGGYQASSNLEGNALTVLDMPPTLGYYGEPVNKDKNTPRIYGSAGYDYDRWPSWENAAAEMEENNVEGTPYSGLKPYRDMAQMDPQQSTYTMPFTSPFFLVGVIRKFNDINKTGPKFSGNLDLLEDNPAIDRIGAIAKSELYFNRPTDVNYFLRLDKKTEKPNVFGPFWQARLAKTNDVDRFLALAIQHKTIWLSGHDAAKIPGMKSLTSELEKILNIFQ